MQVEDKESGGGKTLPVVNLEPYGNLAASLVVVKGGAAGGLTLNFRSEQHPSLPAFSEGDLATCCDTPYNFYQEAGPELQGVLQKEAQGSVNLLGQDALGVWPAERKVSDL